jgi:outer membrane lipoprotein-sorting protein
MLKRTMSGALAATASILVGLAGLAMTADEVLDRMEEESDKLAEGSMVAVVRFDNAYRDGTTASNLFGMLSRPDDALIYFIEPSDVAGTIFLTHKVDEGQGSRMWLYLPLLGIPKELVSDEERGGSFAGSSMSYDDLGGGNDRSDYVATLIGEEELVIGGETRTAYVIESIAEPDVDTDTPRTVLWVDIESFVMLKMEAYNDLGNLDTTVEVVSLTEFDGRRTYAEMLTTDVLEESSTLITVLSRWRPDGEIPEDVFAPENLTAFDPADWGF